MLRYRETAKKLSLTLKALSKKSRQSSSSSANKEQDKGTVVQAVVGALHKVALRGRQLKGSRALGVAASLACTLLPVLLMELFYTKASRAGSTDTNDNNMKNLQNNNNNNNNDKQSSSSSAVPAISAKHEKLISEVLVQLQTVLRCPALVQVDLTSVIIPPFNRRRNLSP